MTDNLQPDDERELARRARQAFDDEELSADVQRRLRLARHDAVAQLDDRATGPAAWLGGGRWMVPVGGAAAVTVAALLLRGEGVEQLPRLAEPELAAAMEMEILDDMEFLAWMLEENPDAG